MRDELTAMAWALLALLLWGLAGKLDEPLEGFDPQPSPVVGDTASHTRDGRRDRFPSASGTPSSTRCCP